VSGWGGARTVVLEHEAAAQLDAARESYHRAGDAWDALEWFLARDPDKGVSRTVGGTTFTLYASASDSIARTPQIVALYSWTDEQIDVFDLRFRAYEPPQANTD